MNSFGKSRMLKDWGKCTEGPADAKADAKAKVGTSRADDKTKVGTSRPTYECEMSAPLKLKLKRRSKSQK